MVQRRQREFTPYAPGESPLEKAGQKIGQGIQYAAESAPGQAAIAAYRKAIADPLTAFVGGDIIGDKGIADLFISDDAPMTFDDAMGAGGTELRAVKERKFIQPEDRPEGQRKGVGLAPVLDSYGNTKFEFLPKQNLSAFKDRVLALSKLHMTNYFQPLDSAGTKLMEGKPLTPEERRAADLFGLEALIAGTPIGAVGNTIAKGAINYGRGITTAAKDIVGDNRFRLSAGGEKVVDTIEDLRPTEKFFQNSRNYQHMHASTKEKLPNILNLAEIIHDTPIENLDSTIMSLIRDNKFDNLIRSVSRPRGNVDEVNSIVRQTLNKYSLVSKDKLEKLDSNLKTINKGSASRDTIYDFVDKAISEGKTFPTNASLAREAGVSENLMANFKMQDEVFKNKVNDIVNIALKGTGKDLKKKFNRETNAMFEKGKLSQYYQDLDPQLFGRINQLREAGGFKEKVAKPFSLFQDYMYDKFRSIKQTSGNEKLTTKDFVNNYLDDTDLEKFKTYVDKEVDRLNLTVASRNVIDELAKDPKYQPYLVKDGKIDYSILVADKAHDIPMFLTRLEGAGGKYKDVGRFKGAGVEPDFIQPNFQLHNRLQLRLDPFANLYADILTQKGLKDKLSKKPIGKIGNKKSSISVSNPINQNLIDTLDEYGYKPDLKKFNNQYEFVQEVSNVIDGLYKDRLIRTIVPIRGPAGKKDSVIFGIEDPSIISVNDRLLLGSERLKEILDYAVENNLKPSDIRDAKGYLKGFKDGGYVGDMIPVKASTGFFARMFGKPPAFRKEGMDVQDITTPTKKQQATLESLYPGVAFPETYPGEVFFSNLELSLAKRDAPKLFATDKEFYDYINRQGVGVDELDDAKVSNYVIQRAKEGQPILSDDVISIAQQSPLRNIYIDAYGFRSDKINIAPKNKFDRTGALVQTAGQGVSKSPSYSNTGLKDGYIDGSYRERVLRLPKDSLRGDPGTIPGGRSPHTFGRDVGDENGVYTIGWTRQTDRPAFILPGQAVNKETGEIIIPPQVADRTQLTNIEDKITKLFEDPITNLRLVDGQFDPDQAALVTQQVNNLVRKTDGKIDADKAYTILLTQAKQKQNQIKKLQNDYNTEKDRLDNFVPAQRQDVVATVIDEAQSDIMQNANRKARELALRLDVMAENNIPLDQVRDKELLEYFKQTGGIARPVGKTKEELKSQFEELKRFNEILKNLSETPPYAITPTAINAYRDQVKNRQTAIIDEMAENISKDLMEQLYPDVPLKDRVQYLDALFKQSVAEAAYRKFIEKDPNAPNFIGVMGGKQVTSSYSQEGSTSTAPEIIADDKKLRIKNFKRRIEAGEETAQIEPSRFPGVGTYEFYGGPEATDAAGKHYTGAAESIMNKIAQEYGSKLQILNVSTGQIRRSEVYQVIDQDTLEVLGAGETYRQAENIANDLVENQGGRYRIKRSEERSFQSEPIYGFELTPQMLQLFKIYK